MAEKKKQGLSAELIEKMVQDDALIEALERAITARGYALREAAERRMAAAEAAAIRQSADEPAKGRRGPRPGMGGRPPKAGIRKLSRGIQLLPGTWAHIDALRLPHESTSDAVERLLEIAFSRPESASK